MSTPPPPPPPSPTRTGGAQGAQGAYRPPRLTHLGPQSRAERTAAQKYMDRVTIQDRTPSRLSKTLAWAGWGASIFILGWMVLYEDFGPQEHCFSSIRRQYRSLLESAFNLSPQERALMSFPRGDVFKKQSQPQAQPSTVSGAAVNDGKPS